MKVFMENKYKILKHNAAYEKGQHSFKLGMNQYGDMVNEKKSLFFFVMSFSSAWVILIVCHAGHHRVDFLFVIWKLSLPNLCPENAFPNACFTNATSLICTTAFSVTIELKYSTFQSRLLSPSGAITIPNNN